MIELTGKQMELLQESLVKSFPEYNDLEQLVSMALEVPLTEIASKQLNTPDTAFEIIKWCKKTERFEDLITGAKQKRASFTLPDDFPDYNMPNSTIASSDRGAMNQVLPDRSRSSEQGSSILGPWISSEAASAKKNEKTPPSEVPSVHKSPPPSTHLVIPLGREFPRQPIPHELFLPPSYLYLGQIDDAPIHHFYREQDQHLALRFPGRIGKHPPFLIDKYTITNQQFCMFLNDLLDKSLAKIERFTGQTLTRCINTTYKQKRLLAVDANDYWKTKHLRGQPWGICYRDETWQPLVNCALLPATLVSWWGAYLYGLWAHRLLGSKAPSSCLPPSQFWRYSAQYDLSTGKIHSYPWGNIWDRFRVNYAGFWAGKEIDTAGERQREWKNNSNARRNACPKPVTDFSQEQGTSGCVQLLGNVWEWCSDSPAGLSSQQHIIMGGSCISPREQCKPTWNESAYDLNMYIGFRCFFMLP